MKHLKKILVVLVLVAMITSSVIVVALANNYTGNIDDAKELYERYENAYASSTKTLDEAKADALVDFYTYITLNPVEPTSEYKALVDKYNAGVVNVLYHYYANCMDDTLSVDEKADQMAVIYTLMASAPLQGTTDISIPLSYKCGNAVHQTPTEIAINELYDGIPKNAACPDGCSVQDQNIVAAQTLSYTAVRKAINALSADITNLIATKLFAQVSDPATQANYFDLVAAKAALDLFNKTYLGINTELVEADVYTGELETVTAKVFALGGDVTFEQLRDGLAEVYAYLHANPVSPAEPGYVDFCNDYVALCDKLVDMFEEKVASSDDLEAQIALFNDMHTYLAGVADDPDTTEVDEYVAPKFISAKLVTEYNALRTAFILENETILNSIFGLTPLPEVIPEIPYAPDEVNGINLIEDLSLWVWLASTYLPATPGEPLSSTNRNQLRTNAMMAYTSLLYNIDPTSVDSLGVTYAELIEDYLEIMDVVIDDYVYCITSAKTYSAKYTALKTFADFLKDFPVSQDAVDLYNAERAKLIEDIEEYCAIFNIDDVLPTVPSSPSINTNANITVLSSLLSDITNAQDAYTAAAIEDKPAALENWKSSVVALYKFLPGYVISPLDVTSSSYLGFYNDYDAARTALIDELLANVDAAEPDDKAAELAEVKAFLAAYPMSTTALKAYNAKVEELFAGDDDKIAAEKLSSKFIEAEILADKIAEVPAKLAEPEPDIDAIVDEMLVDATALFNLYNELVKENNVMDPAYAVIEEKFAAADQVIGDTVSAIISEAINGDDGVAATATMRYYLQYFCEIQYPKTINKLRTQLSQGEVQLAKNALEKLQNSNDPTKPAISVFDKVRVYIDAYNEAQTYEEKLAAFKTFYDAVIAQIEISGVKIDTEAYAAFKEDCTEVYEDFAALYVAEIPTFESMAMEFGALNELKLFIDSYCCSAELLKAYNKKLADLEARNFDDINELISNGADSVVYETPDDLLSDFSGFGTIVSGTNVEISELENYFNKLSGKETDIKAIDPFAPGFDTVFANYAAAMDQYLANMTAEYNAILNSSDDVGAKITNYTLLLETMEASFEQICAYPEIAELYNTVKANCAAAHASNIKVTFNKYKGFITEIHNYMATCPVDKYDLDFAALATYNSALVKLESAEYEEVFAYIRDFENATGGIAAITMSQTSKKIQKYIDTYGLDDSFTDKKVADAFLSDMFLEYLEAFDASLEGLAPAQRTSKISTLANYISRNAYPAVLLELFRAQYPGVSVVQTMPAVTTNTGSLADFSAFVESFYTNTTLTDMQVALTFAVEYLNENPISTASNKEAIDTAIGGMEAKLQAALEIQKELAQQDANFSDYSIEPELSYTMEDGKIPASYFANNDSGVTMTTVSDGGNKYASVKKGPKSTNNSTAYYTLSGFQSRSNFVMEFDLMFPDVENDFVSFQITSPSTGHQYGKGVQSYIFKLTSKAEIPYKMGDYTGRSVDTEFPNYKSGEDDMIAFASGQWMHIAIVLRSAISPEGKQYTETELLVDHVSLGTKKLVTSEYEGEKREDTCDFKEFRWEHNENTAYCIDNLKIYSGTTYRDPDRFTNKSDDELFGFYVDYTLNTQNSVFNRISAYYSASSLYGRATDEQYKRTFSKIDIATLIDEAQQHFESELTPIAAPLNNPVTSSNYTTMQKTIDAVKEYINTNQQYLDQAQSWFVDINKAVVAAEAEIAWLSNLDKFVNAVPLFQRAPTLSALKKHAQAVNEYYELCMLDDPAYLTKANGDSLVQDLLTSLTANDSALAAIVGNDIGKYCTEYMPQRMEAQEYEENARKLVQCVDAIELLVPDKTSANYYDRIVKAAEENVDYVNKYMIVMREIINSDRYDEEYPEIDETLAIYKLLDAKFYEIVQTAHYEHIEERIARYKATNSYIERAGICTYIENYITENNVDVLSQRGALIAYSVAVYKEELVLYKSEYEAILAENTATFISLVEKMKAYTEYGDLKPLYQDAVENYYYNMNVDSDAAKAAIATFAEIEEKINSWELASNLFVDHAKDLASARRSNQIYKALVNCTAQLDAISIDCEGVEDALKVYNEKLAAYTERTDAVNNEISASIDIVCSARTNVVAVTVLAIIKKIFTK